jgi:hypothetical protein
VRLASIAAPAELVKAKTSTIDGEAVCSGLMARHGSRSYPVVRPLYRDPLRLRLDQNMRNLPYLERKEALAHQLRDSEAASSSTNTSPRMVRRSSPTRASLAPRVSFPRAAATGSGCVVSGSKSAIPPASPCKRNAMRSGVGDRERRRCSRRWIHAVGLVSPTNRGLGPRR